MANATNKAAANKTTTKSAASKNEAKGANKEVIAPAVETKADKARAILGEAYKGKEVPRRKDLIATLVKEADLTPAGAATYLQNYKRDNGLTKAAAAPATA